MPAASSSAQGQKLTSQSNSEFKNSENMDHLVKEIAENLKLAETAASGHSTLGDPWNHDLVDPYGPSGNAVGGTTIAVPPMRCPLLLVPVIPVTWGRPPLHKPGDPHNSVNGTINVGGTPPHA